MTSSSVPHGRAIGRLQPRPLGSRLWPGGRGVTDYVNHTCARSCPGAGTERDLPALRSPARVPATPPSPGRGGARKAGAGLGGAGLTAWGALRSWPEKAHAGGCPGCDLHAAGGLWTELRAPARAPNGRPGSWAVLLLEGGTLQAPTALRKGRGSSRSRWGACHPASVHAGGGSPAFPRELTRPPAEQEAKGRCQVTWMTVTSGRDEAPWASRVQGSSHVSGNRLRDLVYPRHGTPPLGKPHRPPLPVPDVGGGTRREGAASPHGRSHPWGEAWISGEPRQHAPRGGSAAAIVSWGNAGSPGGGGRRAAAETCVWAQFNVSSHRGSRVRSPGASDHPQAPAASTLFLS